MVSCLPDHAALVTIAHNVLHVGVQIWYARMKHHVNEYLQRNTDGGGSVHPPATCRLNLFRTRSVDKYDGYTYWQKVVCRYRVCAAAAINDCLSRKLLEVNVDCFAAALHADELVARRFIVVHPLQLLARHLPRFLVPKTLRNVQMVGTDKL